MLNESSLSVKCQYFSKHEAVENKDNFKFENKLFRNQVKLSQRKIQINL